MVLMANSLAKGHSGVRPVVIETLIEMINKEVHPLVPQKGSVGSSGDLAPASHVALVLIGKGEALYKGKKLTGAEAMKMARIKPVKPEAKEGLSLLNNTWTMTSNAIFALRDARRLIKIANMSAGLSVEAIRATRKAYDPRLHAVKPHRGQIDTAEALRRMLAGSKLVDDNKVQDQYSFRCVPQVHGAVISAVDYVKGVVEIEMNSVTDNPLIFEDKGEVELLAGGNFHGEPVAIAMDTLGIAVSEIGNIAERRVASLVDPSLNNGLPGFLVKNGGVNSGFMILQYTAAALVSENKVLAHPASVDSIPTSANIEDHVSMGTIASRKAREIVDNVENVLAIEIMAACQGIDLRGGKDLLGEGTRKSFEMIRKKVPFFEKDTVFYPYIEDVRSLFPSMEKIS
jgi:histidine ammonia-lyase